MAKKGKLPSVQFGRVIRFDDEEIVAFIHARKTFTKGERSWMSKKFVPIT